MNVSNETKTAFAQMQERFDQASPEGGRAEWPDPGEHLCYLTGLHTEVGTFYTSDGDIPSAIVRFEYEVADEDPTRERPLSWPGAVFNLPIDMSRVNEANRKQRADIEMNRLKGHVEKILGRPCTNLAQDIEAIQNQIDGDTSILLKVFVKIQEKGQGENKRVYRTEYIREIISGAVAKA